MMFAAALLFAVGAIAPRPAAALARERVALLERDRDRERSRDVERARERDGDDHDDGRDEIRERRRDVEKIKERVKLKYGKKYRGGGEPTGEASGTSAARLAVQGPIALHVRNKAGDVQVVAGATGEVRMTLTEAPETEVRLIAYGDRVEPEFGGKSTLRRGKLRIEVPRGSRVDLNSMSGDVFAENTEGEVRVRTFSGDVKVRGCAAADVQTISGEIELKEVAGPVRLQTVSGNAAVSAATPSAALTFASTSGNLDWSGTCAKGCRLNTETVSGDVKLQLSRDSSFGLSYVSHSGEVEAGDFPLQIKREPKRRGGSSGGWFEASFGRGEGVIESDAFSGKLVLIRR